MREGKEQNLIATGFQGYWVTYKIDLKIKSHRWAWRYTSVILALWKLRQGEYELSMLQSETCHKQTNKTGKPVTLIQTWKHSRSLNISNTKGPYSIDQWVQLGLKESDSFLLTHNGGSNNKNQLFKNCSPLFSSISVFDVFYIMSSQSMAKHPR